MVLLYSTRLLITLAGGGAALALLNLSQKDKVFLKTAWAVSGKPNAKWDNNWDKFEYSTTSKTALQDSNILQGNDESGATKQKFSSVRHLLLVRHGHYNSEAENDNDMTLTELGREQALFTGQRFKHLQYNYTRIIHSTMTRARETSDIIKTFVPNVPVQSCELLEEGAPIPPEPPVVFWQPEPSQFFKDSTRIEAAFRKYFHRADPSQKSDTYEILVCHGNVIRYFLCRILQFPPEAWLRFSLVHCSVTFVSILPDGNVIVSGVGECGHIPADKISAT